MKVGDLVQYNSEQRYYDAWIGLIIQDIPGVANFKVVKWWHNGEEKPHQLHEGAKLTLLTAKKT